MVVARANAVEERRVHLHAQGFARPALNPQAELDTAAAHLQSQAVLVCKQLVLDDVTGELAVQGDKLVTGKDAGPVGG